MIKFSNTPLLLMLIFSGCIAIQTKVPGFFSGYSSLNADQRQRIIFLPEDDLIPQSMDNKKIYAITANQLLADLQHNDTSVVYFWDPLCSAENCISFLAAQNYCNLYNYTLYVITVYYNIEKTELQLGNTDMPILAINHLYYGTDYCNQYKKLFKRELIKQKLSGMEMPHNFYFFAGDELIEQKHFLFRK